MFCGFLRASRCYLQALYCKIYCYCVLQLLIYFSVVIVTIKAFFLSIVFCAYLETLLWCTFNYASKALIWNGIWKFVSAAPTVSSALLEYELRKFEYWNCLFTTWAKILKFDSTVTPVYWDKYWLITWFKVWFWDFET